MPLVSPVLNNEVEPFKQEADLSIHLIGTGYGVVPEGTQKSIVEIQNDIASEQSNTKNLPRLIWIPENNSTTDERQQLFLNKLQSGKEGIVGADLIVSTLEDFKSIISDKLKKIEEENHKTTNNSCHSECNEESNAVLANSTKVIYLICDSNDLELIQPLEDVLYHNGCEVLLPIFDGDEAQIREDHIENLKICDAAIVFYGNANELWLRSKMRDFIKINGYGRTKPISSKIVYLASPDTASKQRFRSVEAEVINGIHQVPAEKIISLL